MTWRSRISCWIPTSRVRQPQTLNFLTNTKSKENLIAPKMTVTIWGSYPQINQGWQQLLILLVPPMYQVYIRKLKIWHKHPTHKRGMNFTWNPETKLDKKLGDNIIITVITMLSSLKLSSRRCLQYSLQMLSNNVSFTIYSVHISS